MSETIDKIFSACNINVKNWSRTRCLVAVISHEFLGICILSGAWVLCYKYRPLERLVRRFPKVASSVYHKGVTWSLARTRRLPTAITSRTNPERLLISGAESYVFRKLISSVTVPLKIYLTIIFSAPFQNTSTV